MEQLARATYRYAKRKKVRITRIYGEFPYFMAVDDIEGNTPELVAIKLLSNSSNWCTSESILNPNVFDFNFYTWHWNLVSIELIRLYIYKRIPKMDEMEEKAIEIVQKIAQKKPVFSFTENIKTETLAGLLCEYFDKLLKLARKNIKCKAVRMTLDSILNSENVFKYKNVKYGYGPIINTAQFLEDYKNPLDI